MLPNICRQHSSVRRSGKRPAAGFGRRLSASSDGTIMAARCTARRARAGSQPGTTVPASAAILASIRVMARWCAR